MNNLSDIIHTLPPMKSGQELTSALEVLPEYELSICNMDTPIRLMALSDLYKVYVPSQMSVEVYSKLYLALLRSLQKKGTKLAVQQQNQNFKAIMQQEYSGIMGGSDSFTIRSSAKSYFLISIIGREEGLYWGDNLIEP